MSRASEDDLIARYFAPFAGPGALGLLDDAALATPRAGYDLVATKDLLVAGVHFFADDPPDAIARKALRVNLSDLAAKAAKPTGFLLGLALPSDWTEPWLQGFVDGLGSDARHFGCALLGGDTVATPGPLTLSITAFGEVERGRMVPRGGTQAGDRLYVSGTIGDAAVGLEVRRDQHADAGWSARLDAAAAAALLARHRQPEPRLALRAALRAYARAAMDVSDGFVGDLAKMLRLADLGVRIAQADVPLSPAVLAAVRLRPALLQTALAGGDDYELLCAVAPGDAGAFEAAAARAGVPVAALGTAFPGDGVQVIDASGVPLAFGETRFQHFA